MLKGLIDVCVYGNIGSQDFALDRWFPIGGTQTHRGPHILPWGSVTETQGPYFYFHWEMFGN